jgi:hypothetical protein
VPDYENMEKQLAEMQSKAAEDNEPRRLITMLPLEGRLDLTDLCYADIAEIRKVFSERRHALWLDFVGRSKKSLEKLRAIQKHMYEDMFEMSEMGRCNRILEACQNVEDDIKAAREYEDACKSKDEGQ